MIYLDHSATTPVDASVLDAMLPFFTKNFGNPSSVHTTGQTAVMATDNAREQVANFLGAEVEEIIFTSGATEANNLAIKGVITALQEKGVKHPHIITSLIEHPSVIEPCKAVTTSTKYLEISSDLVPVVTYLPVSKNGIIDLEELKKAIRDNTVLISIMSANNEIGSIQPIREIGKIIRKINERKEKDWKNANIKTRGQRPQPIYFHTDATQAINFLHEFNVNWNYIDLLSLSGHKIYGPKGVGALYVKTGVPISPMQIGGGQEQSRRSGTLNTTGIIGLGEAISILNGGKSAFAKAMADEVEKNNKKISKLRDTLISGIKSNIPKAILNTDLNNSIPSVANFSFPGFNGEAIMISLDLEGIAVSTGSACGAGKLKSSSVLLSMGMTEKIAQSSIRFSLGKNNNEDEIKKVVQILSLVFKKLEKI